MAARSYQSGNRTGQSFDHHTRPGNIGELMLNDGVVNGRRRVSHEWIAMSLASQVAISDSDPYADSYGYMWYTKAEPIGSHNIEVHFASGKGGNKIYIVPSLHMVVAITSSA